MSRVDDKLITLTGTVFSGSGACARYLTPRLHGRGLDRLLGYQPWPGSLNLYCGAPVDLGVPHIIWPGLINGVSRPYWFWPARIDELACHAMIPADRGHGPDCLELVSPVRLRDLPRVFDGTTMDVEIIRGRGSWKCEMWCGYPLPSSIHRARVSAPLARMA